MAKTNNIKEKLKANYAKNPRAVTSIGLLAGAALTALIGVLTGVVEPEVAMGAISQLLGALALGG